MHCEVVGNSIENAQNTIVRPDQSFNFHSTKLCFSEDYSADFVFSRGSFRKRFGAGACQDWFAGISCLLQFDHRC